MFSDGSRSRSAAATVRPPTPESKTPIGRTGLRARTGAAGASDAAVVLKLVRGNLDLGRGRLFARLARFLERLRLGRLGRQLRGRARCDRAAIELHRLVN